MTARYSPELPEAKTLPENIKKQLKSYESAYKLIADVNGFVRQLKVLYRFYVKFRIFIL